MDNTNNTNFTTEIVRGLFGPNIAPIHSTHKCTHQRVSGRLYIAPNALCFYSNIFGFERKLLIRIVDITFAGLTRSTSIIIRSKCCIDGRGRSTCTPATSTAATAAATAATVTNTSGNRGRISSGGSSSTSRESLTKQEPNQDHLGTEEENDVTNHTPLLEQEQQQTEQDTNRCDEDNNNDDEIIFEEEHIFKSFEERESVLRTILNLMEKKDAIPKSTSSHLLGKNYQNDQKNMTSLTETLLLDARETNDAKSTSLLQSQSSQNLLLPLKRNESRVNWFDDTHSTSLQKQQQPSLRLRTYSDPRDVYRSNSIRSRNTISNTLATKQAGGGSSTANWLKSKEFSFLGGVKKPKDRQTKTCTTTLSSPNLPSLQDMKANFETNYPDLITQSYTLPNHTIDDFYQTFLQDDAQSSFHVFQQSVMKDENIQVTPWNPPKPDNDGNKSNSNNNNVTQALQSSHQRSMSFIHPRNSKIGPSTAQTRKEQTCMLFQQQQHSQQPSSLSLVGIVLSSSTKFEGVPYSDCFLVEDQWIIEPINSVNDHNNHDSSKNGCYISIRFKVNFIKSTIMKKVIYRQTKQEMKDWFELYIQYLDSITGKEVSASDVVKDTLGLTKDMCRLQANVIALKICIVMLLCCIMGGMYHIYFLHLRMTTLEGKVEWHLDDVRRRSFISSSVA